MCFWNVLSLLPRIAGENEKEKDFHLRIDGKYWGCL